MKTNLKGKEERSRREEEKRKLEQREQVVFTIEVLKIPAGFPACKLGLVDWGSQSILIWQWEVILPLASPYEIQSQFRSRKRNLFGNRKFRPVAYV